MSRDHDPVPGPGPARTATVTPFERLRHRATAVLFEGGDAVPVSSFVTRYERGQGSELHLHPYPEVFVVETGTALFTVGEDELVVPAGHVVVVPAQTPHRYAGAGDDTLGVVAIHPSGSIEQTDL